MQDIAATMQAAGGYIHPQLVVHHAGESLWLSLPRSANSGRDAPPLLEIPRAVHVPVDRADWPHDASVLRYDGDFAGMTASQARILGAMVDLFNACDKVRQVGRSYPAAALARDPQLLALVEEARPGWGAEPAGSPAALVLQSRLLREPTAGDGDRREFLVPLIDLMNHHPYGSRYEFLAESWLVRAHHPTPSDQVFVRYNRLDALAVALHLGYFEGATRFVSAVATRVEVADFGSVEVAGVDVRRSRIPAPGVERVADGIRLTGVELAQQSLGKLRVLLSMPVRSLQPGLSAAQAQQIAQSIITALIEANLEYYQRLALIPDAPGDAAGLRPLLRRVAAHQLGLLRAMAGGSVGWGVPVNGRLGGTEGAAGSCG